MKQKSSVIQIEVMRGEIEDQEPCCRMGSTDIGMSHTLGICAIERESRYCKHSTFACLKFNT